MTDYYTIITGMTKQFVKYSDTSNDIKSALNFILMHVTN